MGFTGRADADSPPGLPFSALFVISLVGGALGALILLATPSVVLRAARALAGAVRDRRVRLGQFLPQGRRSRARRMLPPWGAAVAQFFIAIYGGYFGGGIGFLMLAALTVAGLAVRNAGATKNVLAGVMNASAVAIFVFSREVHWPQVVVTAHRRLDRRLGRRDDAATGRTRRRCASRWSRSASR